MSKNGIERVGERLHGMKEVSSSILLVPTNTLNLNQRCRFLFYFYASHTCGMCSIDGTKMKE